MKHTSTEYCVQAIRDHKLITLGHSQDKETGEVYTQFIDRKKAVALLKSEKQIYPEDNYRIVKETTTVVFGDWE